MSSSWNGIVIQSHCRGDHLHLPKDGGIEAESLIYDLKQN